QSAGDFRCLTITRCGSGPATLAEGQAPLLDRCFGGMKQCRKGMTISFQLVCKGRPRDNSGSRPHIESRVPFTRNRETLTWLQMLEDPIRDLYESCIGLLEFLGQLVRIKDGTFGLRRIDTSTTVDQCIYARCNRGSKPGFPENAVCYAIGGHG